jgi:hypothetical protein
MIELLVTLAVWRLSSLLVNEAGPWSIFYRLRAAAGVKYDEYGTRSAKGLAGILICVWCCSIWVSAIFTAWLIWSTGGSIFQGVIDWLAFSAGAVFIEERIRR